MNEMFISLCLLGCTVLVFVIVLVMWIFSILNIYDNTDSSDD
jgi:hypothetical protein